MMKNNKKKAAAAATPSKTKTKSFFFNYIWKRNFRMYLCDTLKPTYLTIHFLTIQTLQL